MRTTIDLPDDLYRKAKALAELRRESLKSLVIKALEQEVETKSPGRIRQLPVPIHFKDGRVLDLSNFNFYNLLA